MNNRGHSCYPRHACNGSQCFNSIDMGNNHPDYRDNYVKERRDPCDCRACCYNNCVDKPDNLNFNNSDDDWRYDDKSRDIRHPALTGAILRALHECDINDVTDHKLFRHPLISMAILRTLKERADDNINTRKQNNIFLYPLVAMAMMRALREHGADLIDYRVIQHPIIAAAIINALREHGDANMDYVLLQNPLIGKLVLNALHGNN